MKTPEHWTPEDLDTFKERVAINSDGSQVAFSEFSKAFVQRAIEETEEAREFRGMDLRMEGEGDGVK